MITLYLYSALLEYPLFGFIITNAAFIVSDGLHCVLMCEKVPLYSALGVACSRR